MFPAIKMLLTDLAGEPKKSKVDNFQSAVLIRTVGKDPVLNPKYLDFANSRSADIMEARELSLNCFKNIGMVISNIELHNDRKHLKLLRQSVDGFHLQFPFCLTKYRLFVSCSSDLDQF